MSLALSVVTLGKTVVLDGGEGDEGLRVGMIFTGLCKIIPK